MRRYLLEQSVYHYECDCVTFCTLYGVGLEGYFLKEHFLLVESALTLLVVLSALTALGALSELCEQLPCLLLKKMIYQSPENPIFPVSHCASEWSRRGHVRASLEVLAVARKGN